MKNTNKKKKKAIDFIKNRKLLIVFTIIVFLCIGVTLYNSFAYFINSYNSRLLVGKVENLNVYDVEKRYYLEDVDANGNGTNTFTVYGSEPINLYKKGEYTVDMNLSKCNIMPENTLTLTEYSHNNNLSFSESLWSDCDIYYRYNDTKILAYDVNIKIYKENISNNCTHYCGYSETIEDISTLLESGYVFDETSSRCDNNNIKIIFNYKTLTLDVKTQQRTNCYAYFKKGNTLYSALVNQNPLPEGDFNSGQSNNNSNYNIIEDNYGTAYYDRVSPNNPFKYMKFANKYWYIVGINGDKTIRLLYYGDTIGAINNIPDTIYNNKTNGSSIGFYNGSDTDMRADVNPSVISQSLYNFYVDSLYDYDRFISENSVFCNDRIAYINSSSNVLVPNSDLPRSYSINGFSDISFGKRYQNAYIDNPSLKCNLADAFTSKNNSELEGVKNIMEYPIGLITKNEIEMISNSVLINAKGWTLSPASLTEVYSINNFLIAPTDIETSLKINPVISLSPYVAIKGTGSIIDPFSLDI